MIDITGVQVKSQIYQSGNSRVYRGIRTEDNQPVILKCLQQDYPTPGEITRYKQEYQIIRGLNLDGVIKAYNLQKYQNTLVMILEDFGGESLKQYNYPLPLDKFLAIAIRFSDILGSIHAANIIHKDINPANIVLNPTTQELKLIDFGISTVLTRENHTLKNPQVLEGTLAYISPEQTGRMNRCLDYRTDFYSLGATFYELLTGQSPFDTPDVMELVHCHIAKQPVSPNQINPQIPQGVAKIILKLLAKNAEDRYQSAWGLKADLEQCLNQWQTQGTISEFTLGTQDISDRFHIPQKLYGRDAEVATLMATFERVSQGKPELMLVAGYSGIGKSALVQELYKPITQKRGYFIGGKFDQFQRTIPYSAVVSALSELVGQLLTESQEQLKSWREKILNAVGSNGQLMLDVIPELELIIGEQPPVQDLEPNEAQNRFNLVFQNFIRVFCAADHPLVIFLDDLQWVDLATLRLIELIITDEETQYLFLIGAYRDNEVTPTHPLILSLAGLRKQGAVISQITLTPLNLSQITQLIADTLSAPPDSVAPLAQLVGQKTEGNPFFVNEFLKTLYEEKLLNFDFKQREWQWNLTQIEAVGITNNVVELMIGKLQKLPESTQQVLRLAACVGNQFDLSTLAIICEISATDTFQSLMPGIQLGLIQATSGLENAEATEITAPLLIQNYKFLHDRVQQAAYALIDSDHKKAVHLRIGRLLLAHISSEERSEKLFDLVEHLNQGRELITDPEEEVQLAQLNLEAGEKAKYATAYAAAREYLSAGMECLPKNSWVNHYDLTLSLYRERAEVESLNGDFEKSQELINLSLANAQSALDKAEIYNLILFQFTLTSQYTEAIATGRKALKELGTDLPETELAAALEVELAKAKENLGQRDIAGLIDAPEITIPEKRLAIRLLASIDPPAYFSNQELYVVIVAKMAQMSLKYGHVPESAKAYVTYGIILGSVLGDYQSGYEFGQLAVKLSDRFHNPAQKCSACLVLGGHLNHWVKHIKYAEELLNQSYQAGLDSGEFRHSGYALEHQLRYLFYQGKNLDELRQTLPKFLHFNQKIQNQWAVDGLLGFQLTLLNLTGMTTSKLQFHDRELNDKQYLQTCRRNNSFAWLCTFNIFKSQVLYLYGEYRQALKCAREAKKWLKFVLGHFQGSEQNFHESLILAACYPLVSPKTQKKYWQELLVNQKQMKIWAENSPDNFLHKYLLIEAEMAKISGKDLQAMDLYDRAIKSAQENEFIQNEALANERAALFWLDKGKPDFAKIYMQKAHYGYKLWGAKAKVEDLEAKYPQWLGQPQTTTQTLDPLLTETHHPTSTQHLEVLDLATVLKASQAIYGEIVLEKLLENLMKILLENAGAQQGCLILPREGQLFIEAQGSVNPEEAIAQESKPIAEATNLPITVINYVARTSSDVVLSDAATTGQFTQDAYIQAQQLKSLLCTPIIKGGELIAILYLENNLTSGAFTSQRLAILRLLSAQAAIALENSLLYASVEQKVEQRTQELHEKNQHLKQTLDELKRTQAQLIHTEKMSGLGQMVAGVAHEINNPIGFIYSNLDCANDYTQDLLELIQLYQEEYPDPTETITEAIEDIELDFLTEDLQKLFKSMKNGADRIKKIVLGLRNFSRHDESDIKPVDLHEGIDSTLLMLQSRLRGAEGQSEMGEIKVIKKYGNLPQVSCYASELNQVFMNIFNNAIDVLRMPDASSPPTITIYTEVIDSNWVKIRIADNGCGMTEEVKNRMFDPFFTTKPVGSGTGLGLSNSYSIVVNKHGGKFSCLSAIGQGTELIIEIPM